MKYSSPFLIRLLKINFIDANYFTINIYRRQKVFSAENIQTLKRNVQLTEWYQEMIYFLYNFLKFLCLK